MALLNQSVQVYGQLEDLFKKLREGQAPSKFTREFLRDLGFKSSNWHAAIALMKGLGFLSQDGTPTSLYMEFLDKTKWKQVLAHAIKDAYSDIFVMKRDPTLADESIIAGKYRSTYNLSDKSAERAARTFMALLELSDKHIILDKTDAKDQEAPKKELKKRHEEAPGDEERKQRKGDIISPPVALNYNIQIHLPATKEIEVYNSIFKSLREHILD